MELSLHTTFEELNLAGKLSNRVFARLQRAGFSQIKDLIGYDIHSLKMLRVHRMGLKSWREVFDLIDAVKTEQPFPNDEPAPNYPDSAFERVSELLNRAYQAIVLTHTKESWDFKTIYPDAYALHLAVMDEKHPWLIPEEGATIESHLSTRRLLRNYLRRAMDLQESAGFPVVEIFATYQSVLQMVDEHLQLSYAEKYRYFLTEQKRQFVSFSYQSWLKELPNPLRALIEKHNLSLERWIELHESGLDGYTGLFSTVHSEEVINTFFQLGVNLHKEIDFWLSMDNELWVDGWELLRYRQVGIEAFEFVRAFYVKYGYAPLWYILYQTFSQSSSSKAKMFCMRYGLLDGRKHTVYEVAAACHRQRKYVSLITIKAQEVVNTGVLACADWSVYRDLLDLPFITEDTPEFLSIKEQEALPIDLPAFAGLLQLVGEHNMPCVKFDKKEESIRMIRDQYQLYEFGDVPLVINRKLLPSFDLRYSFVCMKLLCSKTHLENKRVFVKEALRNTLEPERALATEVLLYLAKRVLKLEVAEDGSFHPERVRLDISHALEEILSEHDAALNLRQLFEAFKEHYPDHVFTSPSQLVYYIKQSENIRNLSSMGLYRLGTKESSPAKNIDGILFDLLQDERNPLPLDLLVSEVRKFYPKTSNDYVQFKMRHDPLKRFVCFYDGSYGLADKEYGDKRICTGRCVDMRMELGLDRLEEFINQNGRLPKSSDKKDRYKLYRWVKRTKNKPERLTDKQQKRFVALLKRAGQ